MSGCIHCWSVDRFFRQLWAKMKQAKKRLIDLCFFRHEYIIFKIAHICSRTRSEDKFLYAKIQFILVPPPLSAGTPALRLLWRRHCHWPMRFLSGSQHHGDLHSKAKSLRSLGSMAKISLHAWSILKKYDRVPWDTLGRFCRNMALIVSCRGGVLEDVLGLRDILEDTFWSPWPRSLRSSKIALSSARGQHYFLNRWIFVGKRQKPRGNFANTFFVFRNWSIGLAKRASPPNEISPMTKMWQKSLLFLQFQFLFSNFRLHQ